MVANSARAQLNRDYFFPLSSLAPENLVSRDRFDRTVPRQPAHSPHSGRIWRLLVGFLPFSATESTYSVNRHQVKSRVDQVITELRADGVHCRESRASSPQGSSSNECCLFRYLHGPFFMRLSCPAPTINM